MENVAFPIQAIIAAGASASGAVDVPSGYKVVGLIVPPMTGTALTVQASDALTGTYRDVYTGNTQMSITTDAVGRYIVIVDNAHALRHFQLVSNAAGPGFEAAQRTITVICEAR